MIDKWLKPGWSIYERISSTDAWGGVSEGYAASGVPVNCRFRQLSGDRVIRDDANNVIVDAKFYILPRAIKEGDQFRKGDLKFEVKFIHNPMDMDRFLQVELRKL